MDVRVGPVVDEAAATAPSLAGETTVYFTPLATGLAHIKSGRLKAMYSPV